MFKMLQDDKIIDITVYIKEKYKSSNAIVSIGSHVKEFTARTIRKKFFDNEMLVFAEMDSNDEIVTLLLIDISAPESANFCEIMFCEGKNRAKLTKYALPIIKRYRNNICKLKLVLNRNQSKINDGFLKECSFVEELCLRQFNNKEMDILSLAYFYN